jgi:hypothetical protein
MRSEVITVVSVKIALFCDVMQCSLVDAYKFSEGTCCPLHQGRRSKIYLRSTLKIEVVSSSKTLVLVYQTYGTISQKTVIEV